MSDQRDQDDQQPADQDQHAGAADRPDPARQLGPMPMPASLREALDVLDRELHAVALVKLLRHHNLNPTAAQLALRGLQAYLEGDKDRAIQLFETIAEDLRDLTVRL